jgi:hypothetical protein
VATPARKHLSEFVVSLYSARWLATTPSELMSDNEMSTQQAELASRCHIYLVCRRPASSYDPGSVSFSGSRLRGRLLYRQEGKDTFLSFDIEFFLVDGAKSIRVSSYPHRSVETLTKGGKLIRHLPASLLSFQIDPVFRNLEVLYVGQAFAKGKRSAFDRLRSHSTLQRILADMQQTCLMTNCCSLHSNTRRTP